MLRRAFVAVAVPMMIGRCVLELVGCVSAKPAAYATELAACEQTSTSWDQYEPCCAEVAVRYGRDAGFCKRGE